ncbi:SH3 domain-containing protein [Vibrio parahaemolyticus]|uniref:SH3 domain-containing protein n=1 Tax=Vibrio parahaemolyticus TaxID=670 RepID=UPI00225182B1|nr:SH3 domain-containing protein [Vibrio parahaemolyticus]MCX4122071.1 SH3 domain-containing protein [Vibrio parahaemolyticus]HCE4574274.1 SH3 domain-containing protein [Vibrio parahaemolyticus]
MKNQIDSYLQIFRAQQAQMDALMKPFRAQQAQLASIMEPFRAQQAQIDALMKPFRAQQAQLVSIMEPFRAQQAQIDALMKPLSEYLTSGNFERLGLDANGSLSFEGSVIEVDSLKNCFDEVITHSAESTVTPDAFSQWFNSLNEKVKAIVVFFLLPYCISIFANFTTPIYEIWWQQLSLIDQRSAKKEVVKEANKSYDFSELHDYRFVVATVLHVRESGSKNSEIIAELYIGKTVKVINKLKRWTLVEYYDENSGQLEQGWVFSRYLEKFSK